MVKKAAPKKTAPKKAPVKTGLPKPKRKGGFEWKKNQKQTVLGCNGVPVAMVESVYDDILDTTYYKAVYLDKTIAPGKNGGYTSEEKAVNHIAKRFNII